MRFEIEMAAGAATKSQEHRGQPNGDFVGTAEWQGPGQVALDMDEEHKAFFERYFHSEHSCIAPAGDHEGMKHQRPADSEQAFNHALWELSAYSYKVRQGDSRRHQRGSN